MFRKLEVLRTEKMFKWRGSHGRKDCP